jgi:ubiquitin C-terminal hydrolase
MCVGMVVVSFVTPEVMEGANAVSCPTCDMRTTTHKGMQIAQLPHVLTFQVCFCFVSWSLYAPLYIVTAWVQLQRFDFNWSTMTRIKVNDALTFPAVLLLASSHGLP